MWLCKQQPASQDVPYLASNPDHVAPTQAQLCDIGDNAGLANQFVAYSSALGSSNHGPGPLLAPGIQRHTMVLVKETVGIPN